MKMEQNENSQKREPREQETEQGEEKEYSFIEQEVVPKKKHTGLKRLLTAVLVTILLAVIFGLVSSLVYYASGRILRDKLPDSQGEKEKVTLETEVTTEEMAETSTSEDQLDDKNEEKEIDQYRQDYEVLRDIADQVNQSVVTVTGVTNGLDWFLNDSEKTNSTCGLIMANNKEELLILADYDEITEVNEIRITFRDSTTVVGEFYDGDSELGLALISVKLSDLSSETMATYQIAELGESYELEAGVPVLALGNPNGYMYSMQKGMVTNKRTERYITDNKIELFNTNIPVNSNGEGVIVNLEGRIVGFMSHKFNTDLNKNISTCLAVSKVKKLLEDMANQEKRPYFGITGSELTLEAAESLGTGSGIYVTAIDSKSPAFDAGIQRGDIITDVNGTPISSFTNFQSALRSAGVKKTVKVSIVRTTKTTDNVMDLSVTLGVRK